MVALLRPRSTSAEEPIELVARAARGDQRAIRELVERLTPILQVRAARTLLRYSRGLPPRDVRQEVEDLVQIVLSALFANGAKLLFDWDPERGKSFEGYVAMVADSRLSSVLRTRRGRVWPDDPMDTEDLESSAQFQIGPEPAIHSRDELSLVLRRFREVATPRAYELFVLLYVEERTAEEVSSMTGMTVENVHTHKSRLGKLARRVAHEVLGQSQPPPDMAAPRRGRQGSR